MNERRAVTSQGLRAHVVNTSASMDSSHFGLSGPSPYSRPMTTTRVVDKSSSLWKDFTNSVRKRKKKIQKLCEIASDETTTSQLLKRLMLDLRQSTLKLIEDALDIQYRSELGGMSIRGMGARSRNGVNSNSKLPPLTSLAGMDEKEDIFILLEMITDVDELLRIPNVKVFLPISFPSTRNPFLVGKTIDELAAMVTPQPQPGNLEEEMKVLELLRYKRAAKGLLRAEAQISNRTPLSLMDVDRLWALLPDSPPLTKLVRGVLVLLDNDMREEGVDPETRHLNNAQIDLDSHEFLMQLNGFRGDMPMRMDVQGAVRRLLTGCPLFDVDDACALYLIEWINGIVANASGAGAMGATGISGTTPARRAGPTQFQTMSGSAHPAHMAQIVSGHEGYRMDGMHDSKGAPMYKVKHEVSRPTDSEFRSQKKQLISQSVAQIQGATNEKGDAEPKSASGTAGSDRKTDLKRLVAEEVARSFRNQEIKSSASSYLSSKSPGKDSQGGDRTESETLSGVRYELLKIQQELLRRQVLDPKYYNAASLDTIVAENKGLSISKDQKTETKRYAPIAEQEVLFSDGTKGGIEVLQDLLADNVLLRLLRYVNLDAKGQEIDPERIASGEEIVVKIGKEAFAFMRVSKLMLNRITNWTMENVLQDKGSNGRLQKLELLLHQMKMYANQLPIPRGKLFLIGDRTLFSTHLAAPGVSAMLTISRNDECTGVILVCTPLQLAGAGARSLSAQRRGESDATTGPITLLLSDKELQVLLINQRSLYLLAQSKWSCMEMVAQWLATRITIKKVRVVDAELAGKKGGKVKVQKLSMTLPDATANETASVHTNIGSKSAKTIDSSQKASLSRGRSQKFSRKGDMSMKSAAESVASISIIEVDKDDEQDAAAEDDDASVESGINAATGTVTTGTVAKAGKFVDTTNGFTDGPVLLDLKIDRKVDIAKVASAQWKCRNIPVISGINVKIKAWQDLEILKIQCLVSVPHPKNRKDTSSSMSKLIDYSKLNENEEDVEDYFNEENCQPIEFTVTFQLTSFELIVFGANESIDDRHITLSNATASDHPSTFMWNILSRLHLVFKGSIAYPYSPQCNADKPENWYLKYDRRLLRDIRTISGGVVVVSASVVGNELLFEAEPTDGSIYDKVGSKLMQEGEILELIQSEGWPISLLEYNCRTRLAYRILDKLKIVEEYNRYRLEPYNYAESRLLEIMRQVAVNKPNVSLGSVEINSHHSLSDLRALILHELDKDTIPKSYRFLYKGAPCAVRQEGFRKAWELLPRVILVSKVPKIGDSEGKGKGGSVAGSVGKGSRHGDDDDDENSVVGGAAAEDGDKGAQSMLDKGLRRVGKKLVPIPIPTLGYVREGSDRLYLMHDAKGLIMAGDVIRIGDIKGRDYVVAIRSRQLQNAFPKTLRIQPEFNMKLEVEFEKPIVGSMPYPADKAGLFRGRRVLGAPHTFGLKFDVPKDGEDEASLAAMRSIAGGSVAATSITTKKPSSVVGLDAAELDDTLGNKTVLVAKKEELGKIWTEVWLWKCVSPSEDTRPKWRKMYDNGQVRFQYDYANSSESVSHFRVKAPFSYLEVLVTDCRCPDMTQFAQRVHEMYTLTHEYFIDLAFNSMCDWYPQFKRGVDSTKFVKFIREAKIFPDIKEPSRIGQIDMMFMKELKGEHSIVDKYVTFEGFLNLLYKVAMARYPPSLYMNKDKDEGSMGADDGATGLSADDMRSIGESSLGLTSMAMSAADAKKPKIMNVKSVAHQKDMKKKGEAVVAKQSEDVTDDPEYLDMVLKKFVSEFITAYPAWSDVPWNHCKLVVMKKEAIRYCAATRIGSKFRGGVVKTRYIMFRKQMIILQSHIRRKIQQLRSRAFVRMLIEDWLFRERYRAATKINSIVRKYIQRCRHCRTMAKIRANDIAMQKARRFRLKKLRAKAKKGIIYKELKRINGFICLVQMRRKDARNYSQDYGMLFQVYIPKYQQTTTFVLEEPALRESLQKTLGYNALSIGDLVDKRNLQKIVGGRLVVRARQGVRVAPRVFFAKQSIGQRGGHVLDRGRVIDGEMFVCKVFSTGGEVAVQAYHPHTSRLFQCSIRMTQLHEWVTKVLGVDEGVNKPAILEEANEKHLFRWAVDHIVVDKRKGQFRVLFGCQFEKSKKAEYVVKLQAAWRRALVYRLVVRMMDIFIYKIQTAPGDNANIYYLNAETGESMWEKPRLLGSRDIPTEPAFTWKPFNYWHDGALYQHYVNPYSGKYTHFTVDQAAIAIQRMVRRHELRMIAVPLDVLRKIVTIEDTCKAVYDKDPRRLASVINYALVAHALRKDEPLARRLYMEALELSDSNALVTRATAIFSLAVCDPPLQNSRKKAEKKLLDAKNRDETGSKFKFARYFFCYATMQHPFDIRFILDLALVDLFVFNETSRAEKMFRRAVSLEPFNDRVVKLWEYVKDRFDEKRLAYYPQSRIELVDTKKGGKQRTIHGRPVNEDPNWAGWVWVPEDPYGASRFITDNQPYWYNPVDGTETLTQPDWKKEWEIRMRRSKCEKTDNGLEYYFDPLTGAHFQRHILSNTFQ